jgi:hypothetical protein
VTSAKATWIFLAFRLPSRPSTPRIAAWRKLKRLGAVQVVDCLVALPLDARNREQFEWLSQDILDSGGEATIWIGSPTSTHAEQQLIDRMREAVSRDYQQIIDDSLACASQPPARRRRSLARLRRELRRVRDRDYFPPPDREPAQQAVDALGRTLETTSSLVTRVANTR